MPRPALRSRTKKRKLVRTPGGRLSLHVVDKKHDYPKCALCGRPLHGVSKLTTRKERKGVRMPSRPYGGYLCHECLERALKMAIYKMKS